MVSLSDLDILPEYRRGKTIFNWFNNTYKNCGNMLLLSYLDMLPENQKGKKYLNLSQI